MTKIQKPIIHGRDHERGGADPIRMSWETGEPDVSEFTTHVALYHLNEDGDRGENVWLRDAIAVAGGHPGHDEDYQYLVDQAQATGSRGTSNANYIVYNVAALAPGGVGGAIRFVNEVGSADRNIAAWLGGGHGPDYASFFEADTLLDFWFKIGDLSNQASSIERGLVADVTFGSGSNMYGWFCSYKPSTGRVRFWRINGNPSGSSDLIETAAAVSTTEAVHVTVTYTDASYPTTAGNLNLYINGALAATEVACTQPDLHRYDAGSSSYGGFTVGMAKVTTLTWGIFDGDIDEIDLWVG